MKIKLVFLLLFALLYHNTKAQGYEPMLNGTLYWYVTSCGFFCNTDHYFAKEDTLINGQTYTFLDNYHFNKNVLLREDTLQRKVYFYRLLTNKETLLYDFSLIPGDSIEIKNPYSPIAVNAGWYTLDSIRMEPFLNGSHKVFYLSENNGNNTTLWIESIGSRSLINTPALGSDLNGVGDLTCVYRNGIQIFQSDTLPTGACDTTLMTSIAQTESNYSSIRIFPQPASDLLTIALPYFNTKPWKLSILDIHGQCIFEETLKDLQTTIDTQLWPSGLYLLCLKHENESKMKKIIIR